MEIFKGSDTILLVGDVNSLEKKSKKS